MWGYYPEGNCSKNKKRRMALNTLIALLFVLMAASGGAATEPFFYTVQISSHKSLENSQKLFSRLKDSLPENYRDHLRIEYIKPYYTIRTGKFDTINETTTVLDFIKKNYPDAAILRAHIRADRITALYRKAAVDQPRVSKPQKPTPPVTVSKTVKDPAPSLVTATANDQAAKPVALDNAANKKSNAPSNAAPIQASKPTPKESSTVSPVRKNSGGKGAYMLLGLILVIAVTIIAYKTKKRPSRPNAPDEDDQYEIRSPAALTYKYKSRLNANLKELAMVEGNLLSHDKDAKTLYITSCLDAGGKTTAAVSIAYSLAMNSAARILLIDGNPKSPMIHRLFGAELSPGLVDLLQTDIGIDKVCRKTEYGNLAIITAGELQSEGQSPLRRPELKDKLDQLAERFDYVVFDGQSILVSADTALIANQFNGIIVAVECEKTKQEVLLLALDKAGQTGGNVLAVVLNKRHLYIPEALYGKI